MRKKISIYDRNNNLLNEFSIRLEKRETKNLKLDIKNFYEKYSGNIPEETVEMMIEHSNPFTIPKLLEAKTHIHQGNDGKWYICYPREINSLEEAIELAKNWALGTVFHMQERADISWFESFGDWMILATKSKKRKMPSSFKEFPLWIQNGFLKWKIKIDE